MADHAAAGPSFPVTVTIAARPRWNDTGLWLTAGTAYAFSAAGTWRDWTRVCGADGYASDTAILRAAEGLRRLPDQDWFTLVAGLDRDPASLRPIGGRKDNVVFDRDGTLTCFANDVWLMYFNNCGAISLTVDLMRPST
jgi:hypothetical protein